MPSSGGTTAAVVIHPDAILAVVASCDERGPRVVARGQSETPPGAVAANSLEDPTALGATLRTLFRDMGIRDREVRIVLPSSAYSVRGLRLPELPEKEQRPVVRGELEQNGAVPFGSGAFDFLWLGSASGAPGSLSEAFAYYASSGVVETVISACAEAGLKLAALEPTSLAAMRAFLACAPDRQPVAILIPAEKHTDLCIFDGQRARHFRRIASGWLDLKRENVSDNGLQPPLHADGYLGASEGELADALEEAPVVQIATWSTEGEAVAAGASESAGTVPTRTRRRRAPVTPAAPDVELPFLASEVARTLAFYTREYADSGHPQQIVILGPHVIANNVAGVLRQAVSLPVTRFDLAAEVALPPASPAGGTQRALDIEWAAAVGAACAGQHVDRGLGIVNLLDEAALRRRRSTGDRRLVIGGIAGAAVWLAVSVFAAAGLLMLQSQTEGDIEQTNEAIRSIEAIRAPALRAQELATGVEVARKAAEVPAAAVLGRVAAATPPGIGLQNLTVNADGSVSMSGTAASPLHIQRFALDLVRGTSLSNASVDTMNKDDKGRYTFNLSARFRDAAPAPTAGTTDTKSNP